MFPSIKQELEEKGYQLTLKTLNNNESQIYIISWEKNN